jgi:hypothetical protein
MYCHMSHYTSKLDLAAHMKLCDMKQIPCSNRHCDQIIVKKHYTKHVEDDCEYRLCACRNEEHGCTVGLLTARKMGQHELKECQYRQIKCVKRMKGCRWSGCIAHLYDHLFEDCEYTSAHASIQKKNKTKNNKKNKKKNKKSKRKKKQRRSMSPLSRNAGSVQVQVLSEKQIKDKNVEIKHLLEPITMTCVNGCSLVASLAELTLGNHQYECAYRLVECPYGCALGTIPFHRLEQHKSICVRRPTNCEHKRCHLLVPFAELEGHLTVCDYRPTSCRYVPSVLSCFLSTFCIIT